MDDIRLFIPKEILTRIEGKCKKDITREYFLPKDLVIPLRDFIDERLEKLEKLEKLDRTLYKKYMFHRGTEERTLRYAWASIGKGNDGALENLRNLLCYFGFEKNWEETIKYLNIDKGSVINLTKQIKEILIKRLFWLSQVRKRIIRLKIILQKFKMKRPGTR
jgi:hypothetical protein